ncbi:hypothetical protein GS511_08060 [Leptospira borgpetersenii]|uniref:Uncharacterized protein n=4 Tax=Leptospira borgpetersenii TaxID=174 RepID=M3HPR7_LEPBO|nr:hypothetical protein LBBP_01981 [Leptospira borgpetersenii serovar Ballum]EKP14221.1 hypothetical protein LEP1GSC128_2980 [Leptospira borgpetersenii str. 200801926]EKR01996.1 hypothetical protein LEP1GSC121_3913 [Leptospira borgpetersenii serovar Castellonis str. 200801910]EMG00026.1 hypothetical protein LEP1GSC123_4297 [Leptospira borgpetersenii str. 200701203]EMK10292.1 hypothetical protein LEP1GSC066_3372 [Leptospira sp. serovar Kenya str. Sh9]EMN14363.1 hypothetical protein LEP1GSC055_2
MQDLERKANFKIDYVQKLKNRMNNCNSLSILIDGIFFGNTKFSLTPTQKKQHKRRGI